MCGDSSFGFALVLSVCLVLPAAADVTLNPTRDGTLVDGGVYGSFDGAADAWDYTFNGVGGYEGSITLTVEDRAASAEYRVFWEYNLSTVSLTPPVEATLTFTLRGAPIFPFPDMNVNVYAYPSDLAETPDDFSAGPAALQDTAVVAAFLESTHNIDVSGPVNEALLSGEDRVAFRFQIDPDTPYTSNQAFMDAEDADPSTKPLLTLAEAIVPGDLDEDRDADLDDHAILAGCLTGPDHATAPGCEAADLDVDDHVDLRDFALFQSYFAP